MTLKSDTRENTRENTTHVGAHPSDSLPSLLERLVTLKRFAIFLPPCCRVKKTISGVSDRGRGGNFNGISHSGKDREVLL